MRKMDNGARGGHLPTTKVMGWSVWWPPTDKSVGWRVLAMGGHLGRPVRGIWHICCCCLRSMAKQDQKWAEWLYIYAHIYAARIGKFKFAYMPKHYRGFSDEKPL